MMDKTTVTVLMGGPDAEHDVSLQSGSRVAEALAGFDDLVVRTRVLPRTMPPDRDALAAMFDEDECDVVFPVLHGPWGEGGPLQRMLESIGRPFVGCGAEAAAIAMDKLASKRTAAIAGLPTPDAVEVIDGRPIPLDTPFVIKPVDEGSSVGVRFVHEPADADAAIAELRPSHRRLMAESFVRGRELTLGILGDRALPIIEIVPTTTFYDYDAKYLRDDTRYVVNPPLPDGVAEQIARWSLDLHHAIDARQVSRVDWLLETPEDGSPPQAWFLEVNTMPGMTSHSLVPKAAAAIGIDFASLCRSLVVGCRS
jgi:D-alanine-D-alanine ligase